MFLEYIFENRHFSKIVTYFLKIEGQICEVFSEILQIKKIKWQMNSILGQFPSAGKSSIFQVGDLDSAVKK